MLERLSELNLAHNQLDAIPKSFCTGELLQQSLAHLDISDNRFTRLAPWFCELRTISTLKLDRNELEYLPFAFGHLRNLSYFSAIHNKLKTLPSGFLHLRLQNLDLSDNALLEDGPSTAVDRLDVPSLLECSARRIHKDK